MNYFIFYLFAFVFVVVADGCLPFILLKIPYRALVFVTHQLYDKRFCDPALTTHKSFPRPGV